MEVKAILHYWNTNTNEAEEVRLVAPTKRLAEFVRLAIEEHTNKPCTIFFT